MTDTDKAVPAFTLGWRLRLALEHAGISVQDMAAELEVSRDTMHRWTHDQAIPRRIFLQVWADRCGVPYEWLVEDDLVRPKTSPGAGGHRGRVGAGRRGFSDNRGYTDPDGARQQRAKYRGESRPYLGHSITVIRRRCKVNKRLNNDSCLNKLLDSSHEKVLRIHHGRWAARDRGCQGRKAGR